MAKHTTNKNVPSAAPTQPRVQAHGKIVQHANGLGTVTPEMVHQ